MKLPNVHIAATGVWLPKQVLSNYELAKTLETTDEWIVSHTGIRNRHIAEPEESTASGATHAARQALERAGVAASDLGSVIVATSTPDYSSLPATACLVQSAIGAVNAGAFDVSAACTGFIYALQVARGLMASDPRPTLVIGADLMSRIIDWKDRNLCVLFGDGAGAAVLKHSEQEGGLLQAVLRADGSGASVLLREGGSRTPTSGPWTRPYLQMQGKAVFNFAVKAIDQIVRELLEKSGLAMEDIAWIVPHQANIRIIEASARRLGASADKFFLNIGDVANTSAATVPIAFDQLVRENRVKAGDWIILVGFGAGLTYGGILMRWFPGAVAPATPSRRVHP
jgi:3-oxoacyl-[acyl-carrier-protein] synthase-3